MLPNHSPLAVAERFGMLEALHPDRIDLGLGRAPGTDQRTAMVLRSGDPNEFPEQFAQLRGYLGNGYGGIRAVDGRAHGARAVDARLDRRRRAHRRPARDPVRLRAPLPPALHRARARSSTASCSCPPTLADVPRTIVAAGIVVGEDDEHAARLALPGGVSMLWLRQGRPAPLPTVEEAEAIVAGLSGAELAGRRGDDRARDRRRPGDRARAAARPHRAHGHRRAHGHVARRRPGGSEPRPRARGTDVRAAGTAGRLTSAATLRSHRVRGVLAVSIALCVAPRVSPSGCWSSHSGLVPRARLAPHPRSAPPARARIPGGNSAWPVPALARISR